MENRTHPVVTPLVANHPPTTDTIAERTGDASASLPSLAIMSGSTLKPNLQEPPKTVNPPKIENGAVVPNVCKPSNRVYLSEEWYVDVDEEGVVRNPCAEGALGYVLQLQPTDPSTPMVYAALKLPRLRADTIEENANITEILHAEQRNVERNRTNTFLGLVPAERRNANFLRRERRLGDHERSDARQQDGCVPLVSFRPDSRVRICNVRFVKDDTVPGGYHRQVFPPGAEASLSFLTYQQWREYEPSCSGMGIFDHPVVFRDLHGTASPVGDHIAPRPTVPTCATRTNFYLDEALRLSKNREVFFAGLPSILFTWAHGTLQETIGEGLHKHWDLWACYQLVQGVLLGLQTLHQNGLVHADLRPANIMSVLTPERVRDIVREKKWHELVKGFRVSDYGSFGCDLATMAPTPEGSGHTSMPGVTRHRVSVFYGRERRSGIEREDADLAIIFSVPDRNRPDGFEYFIRLGWKRQLQIPGRNEVRPSVLRDMQQVAHNMQRSNTKFQQIEDWSLTEGDQFRIRDYVFLVKQHVAWNRQIDAKDDGYLGRESRKLADNKMKEVHCLDFLCAPHYTRLLMEKIVLREDAPLSQGQTNPEGMPSYLQLDLPRWTEIRQSSYASDIFSIGVLALYLPYTAQRRKSAGETGTKITGQVDADTINTDGAMLWDAQNIEESVAAIVRRLEDENNFRHLFPEMEEVCKRLENAIRYEIPASVLLRTKVNELDQLEVQYQHEKVRRLRTSHMPAVSSVSVAALDVPVSVPPMDMDSVSKSERVRDLHGTDMKIAQSEFRLKVKNLIETTQFLSEELVVIAEHIGNYGHFLFFLHFVLACLHRQTSLKSGDSPEQPQSPYPFCKNRCDTDMGLAVRVRDRIKRLLEFQQHTWFFDALQRELSGVIRKGVPILPDYKIRERLLQLEEKVRQTTREKELAETALRQHQQVLEQKEVEARQLQNDKSRLEKDCQRYLQRVSDCQQKQDELKREIDASAAKYFLTRRAANLLGKTA